jgi:hypothetical protein
MSELAPSSFRLRRVVASAASAVALLSATGLGGLQAAPAPAPASAQSVQGSFAGVAYASGTAEDVDLGGRLHVVTTLQGSETSGWTLEWHTNLQNTAGDGHTTGDRYRAAGTDRGTVEMPPGPPTRTATFEPELTLYPPGPPVHPSPVRLTVRLGSDESGEHPTIDIDVHRSTFGTVD